MERVAVISAVRTPIGAYMGALREIPAYDLGALVLAAPQIGISQRVVIFSVRQNPRYPEAEPVPETVLINPRIEPLGEWMTEGWEGCLSIPGMRGKVPRYEEIIYRGYDQKGQFMERRVSGFHARVVQHEVDHLDGVLYPQRIRDMQAFGFEDELNGHEN